MRTSFLRRHRRWLAAAMMFALAFAGIVATAHACSLERSSSQPIARALAVDPGMVDDCMGMAGRIDSTSSACETHCVAGQQAGSKAEGPVAPMAFQPVLRIPVAEPALTPSSTDAERRSGVGAAPPAQLRFTRLQI